MATDEGWTHIRRKTRRNTPATRTHATTSHSLPDKFEPRTTGILRSPETLRVDYDKIHEQWLASPTHQALIKLVDTHTKSLVIKTVVCLGIGTFDPEDGAWETKRAAFVQLCALSTLTSQLEKYNKGSIECIFQEPIFTHSDKTFLHNLGHTVVASPAAYNLIDASTALFAVHLYRPIYAAALQSSLPAIFIGTGWDVWDTVTMEKSNDLENMKVMDETYSRCAFPQDGASTAFSSTSIYFKPTDKAVVEAAAESSTDKPLKPAEAAETPESIATSSETAVPSRSPESKDATEASHDSVKAVSKDDIDHIPSDDIVKTGIKDDNDNARDGRDATIQVSKQEDLKGQKKQGEKDQKEQAKPCTINETR